MFIKDVFTEEHAELRTGLRRFLEQRSPETEVRRLMETDEGYDPAVWSQMAGQLGLQGLGIPETFGGSGFGPEELAIVFEELGRSLLPSPYLPSVALAANLLQAIGDTGAQERWLPGITSGEVIATVAIPEESGSWNPENVRLEATASGDGWILNGVKSFVVNGNVADLVLVVARAGGGLSVLAVEKDAPGMEIRPLITLDMTRKQAELRFAGTPATLLGAEGGAGDAVTATLDLAALALAAEQTGAAGKLMEMSLEYAKTRYQFGRPIGSYQAIKHKLAEMAFDLERMESVVRHGAKAAAACAPDLPVVASLAKAFCSEASFRMAAENIGVHGGIGFTWEHPSHLYFRRAKSTELLLGAPKYHRELVLRRLGI